MGRASRSTLQAPNAQDQSSNPHHERRAQNHQEGRSCLKVEIRGTAHCSPRAPRRPRQASTEDLGSPWEEFTSSAQISTKSELDTHASDAPVENELNAQHRKKPLRVTKRRGRRARGTLLLSTQNSPRPLKYNIGKCYMSRSVSCQLACPKKAFNVDLDDIPASSTVCFFRPEASNASLITSDGSVPWCKLSARAVPSSRAKRSLSVSVGRVSALGGYQRTSVGTHHQ